MENEETPQKKKQSTESPKGIVNIEPQKNPNNLSQ